MLVEALQPHDNFILRTSQIFSSTRYLFAKCFLISRKATFLINFMNQLEKPFDKHDYVLGQIPNVFCFSRGEKIYTVNFKIRIRQMTTAQWNVGMLTYY